MSENPTFVQALANACGKPVEVSPVDRSDHPRRRLSRRARRRRRGRTFDDIADVVAPARPWSSRRARSTASSGRQAGRAGGGWIPDLSALDF